jgi:methylated-DNA-[protein]-cysteine S-methyltransferase
LPVNQNSLASLKIIDSPIGLLALVAAESALRAILFESQFRDAGLAELRQAPDPVLESAATQLAEYFEGRRSQFELSLAPRGTAFQRQVWDALAEIPFGQTRSYADIANRLGRPTATRAVGAANGRNPLPIVVPCHRVIGADGSLTGFAGGLDAKRFLLQLEAAV